MTPSFDPPCQDYGSHGSGPGQFGASIRGVAVHGSGEEQRIAACDRINHRVHIFSTATGRLVTTIGSEGKGKGEFVFPVGAAFNKAGDLFVSDMVLGRMQVRIHPGAKQEAAPHVSSGTLVGVAILGHPLSAGAQWKFISPLPWDSIFRDPLLRL